MTSLKTRLLLASFIILISFFWLTALALDRAYHDSAVDAFQDRLLGHVYSLLAASNITQGQLQVAKYLPQNEFSIPQSGLYGQIISAQSTLWKSPSLQGIDLSQTQWLDALQKKFSWDQQHALFRLDFGVIYEQQDKEYQFTFTVAESTKIFHHKIKIFRYNIFYWLSAATIALLLAQFFVLRWGLAPLKTVSDDLEAIEQGNKFNLSGKYPKELQGLTQNINDLLSHERSLLKRYKNTMADLAHSLKTPLTVMQNLSSEKQQREQVNRMRQIIDYQLQRAATSGRTALNPAVDIALHCQQIIDSLDKVYPQKKPQWELNIDPQAAFYGEPGDLMEILGNLMENACKWCQSTIRIQIKAIVGNKRNGMQIRIEDDGKGIDDKAKAIVLARGIRSDQSVEGHGIGLAITQQIVDCYHGTIEIKNSTLGGAFFMVNIAGE